MPVRNIFHALIQILDIYANDIPCFLLESFKWMELKTAARTKIKTKGWLNEKLSSDSDSDGQGCKESPADIIQKTIACGS